MSTIDPRLRYQMNSVAPESAAESFGLSNEAQPAPTAEVLVRLRLEHESTEQALEAIRNIGMDVRYVVPGPYTVLSGSVALDQISEIEKLGSVRRIEASRLLTPELDLCVSEVKAAQLHSANPAIKGAGVIIG